MTISRDFFPWTLLPREIRDMIYHYLWSDTLYIFRHRNLKVRALYPEDSDRRNLFPSPSKLPLWLLASTEFFNEGLDQFYRRAIFTPMPWGWSNVLYSKKPRVKPQQALSLHRARMIDLTRGWSSGCLVRTWKDGDNLDNDRQTQNFGLEHDYEEILHATIVELSRASNVRQLRLDLDFASFRWHAIHTFPHPADEHDNNPNVIRSRMAYLDQLPNNIQHFTILLHTGNDDKKLQLHKRVEHALKEELERIATTTVNSGDAHCRIQGAYHSWHSSRTFC